MGEKHNRQFTVKLTDSEYEALETESDMQGMSEADLIRSMLGDLRRKQLHTYRLLAEKYQGNENNENTENTVYQMRGVK